LGFTGIFGLIRHLDWLPTKPNEVFVDTCQSLTFIDLLVTLVDIVSFRTVRVFDRAGTSLKG